MTRNTRHAIPYANAIEWLAVNDDTEWVSTEKPIISVTACLVADIYGRSNEEVIADLQKFLGLKS